jgi:hypothetical protein
MLGWIFGGLVKKLERSAKKVERDFVDRSAKKLNKLANNIDYMVAKRTDKVTAKIEKLETKTVNYIENIINKADQKVKENLQEIDRIREETIKEVNKTIKQTDAYIENRINQISLVVMESIVEAKGLIRDVELLENKIFNDASFLIDQIEEIVDKTLEQVRGELRRHSAELIPNPFDPCRQKLGLGLKLGFQLSDIEYYRLIECYELTKLTPTTPVQTIIETYGQLQLNAARMVALTRKAPELRKFAVEDWLKYGVLCQFWSNTIKIYDSTELEIESSPSQQQLNYQDIKTQVTQSFSNLQQMFSKPTE